MAPAEIAGFNETMAAELFASQATFMLGCQYASLIIDTFLGGVLFMQVHQYYKYQWDDKRTTKMIVAWTTAINVLVTCYYWAYISDLYVANYGRWLPWLEVRWLMMMPVFDVMCVCVVQGFFAYRAFLLCKRNWYLLGVIAALILAAVGAALGVTIVFGQQSSLLDAAACGPTLITWTACTTAADILIAVSILYGLLKSKSGWAHTDKLVTRLIRMIFETQLPPTLLSIAYVAEWSVQPSSLLGAVFQALECKTYTVGLLVCLNSRISFTRSMRDNQTIGGNPPQVYGMSTRQHTGQIQVEVETETYIQQEESESTHRKKDSYSDMGDGTKNLVYQNASTARLTHPGTLL